MNPDEDNQDGLCTQTNEKIAELDYNIYFYSAGEHLSVLHSVQRIVKHFLNT